ncbi:PREDICTED: uncharacterized protein LOC105565609 isoform X2 [Vollenhovia emeryi]|nr:PREDICTED: uncharacterized protein LOC105565609 isoform X2 [Vollenhovia emeryi]
MDDRLKAIDEYYTNLEYQRNVKETSEVIGTKLYDLTEELIEEINLGNVNDFTERYFKAVSLIEKNLPLFKAACTDPDIITTIIEHLNYFGARFSLDSMKYDEQYMKDDLVLLFTILKISENKIHPQMKPFLEDVICKGYIHRLRECRLGKCTTEMILLGDSDLYAVIRCLKNTPEMLHDHNTKFWIQEPIKEKFLWLLKEYLLNDLKEDYSSCFPICTFRTTKELFTDKVRPYDMNIVSIWTEDIVFAKNLAMPLNRDVVFINTYMNFHGGIVLLPFARPFKKTLESSHFYFAPDNPGKVQNVQKSSVNNLFYDGAWQRPVNDTYWIHDDTQWANATSDDVKKCISSAEKGFKIWSSKSVTSRKQILSKFASVLESNGKSALADIISKWIKFSCIYENSLSCSQSSGKLEVTKLRKSRGVIVLKEKDEAVLFRRLMQILTVGNSVIVICNTDSCSLVPYCNMFSISEIPPGVINLLSTANIKELEKSLFEMEYESYAKQLFSDNNFDQTYINLTEPKQIIMPLK